MRVGDVEVAGGVDGDAGGRIEIGGGCGCAVASITLDSSAGDNRDRAGTRYFADDVIPGVGKVEVAALVVGKAAGIGNCRRGGRTAIAGVAQNAGSGDGGDGPRGRDSQ